MLIWWGGGGLLAYHSVCQKVYGLPSKEFSAAPGSPTSSWLSTLTRRQASFGRGAAFECFENDNKANSRKPVSRANFLIVRTSPNNPTRAAYISPLKLIVGIIWQYLRPEYISHNFVFGHENFYYNNYADFPLFIFLVISIG